MTIRSTSMTIGPAVAAAVSIAALLIAGDAERQAMGMPVAPFGWKRLIVVHAVASLPLSWMLACALQRHLPTKTSLVETVLWTTTGLAVAWATAAGGDIVGQVLDTVRGGSVTRLLTRAAWCAALETPWCLAAMAAVPDSRGPGEPALRLKSFMPLALVVAVIVPLGYVDRLIDEQTLLAKKHCGNRHLEKARNVVWRLCDAGSGKNLWEVDADGDGAIEEYPPLSARAVLENDLARLRREIAALGSAEPTGWQRIQLAQGLASVGELTEAQRVIEPLAAHDARAAVVLAQVYQQRREWPESSRWFRRALELARSGRARDPAGAKTSEKIQVHAYNVLAHNARELDRYDAAEQHYFDALARLPSQRAYYHHQLGRHYEVWGRPVKAVEHFRKAFELEPQTYGEPAGVTVKVLSAGTPVGIFRPGASNYE